MTLIPRPNLPSLLSNKHIPFYGDWPNSVANATATRLIRHPNARYSEQEGAPRSVRSENARFDRVAGKFRMKDSPKVILLQMVTCMSLSDESILLLAEAEATSPFSHAAEVRHVGIGGAAHFIRLCRTPHATLHHLFLSRCHTICCRDHLMVAVFFAVSVYLL
jgi:hypothetical protein